MNYYPSLTVGDLLTRPKILGVVEHVGVLVASNTVLHNTPEQGEHLATVQEFSAGRTFKIKRTGANPVCVVERSNKILSAPQRYDVATRNCEHTAYEVIRGVAKSPQFIAAVIIAILIFVSLAILRRYQISSSGSSNSK